MRAEMARVEEHRFQAETQKLLDLMIHSLYSNKEIFLRELISNASDALDRLRFEALTDPMLLEENDKYEIRLEADKEARTLSVSDTGIGMSRDEVIANIGTIARSGTDELRKGLEAAPTAQMAADLIGRFGVGFYSSIMAFRTAHHLVGSLIREVIENNQDNLETAALRLKHIKGFSVSLEKLDPASVAEATIYGGGPGSVSLNDCIKALQEKWKLRMEKYDALPIHGAQPRHRWTAPLEWIETIFQ